MTDTIPLLAINPIILLLSLKVAAVVAILAPATVADVGRRLAGALRAKAAEAADPELIRVEMVGADYSSSTWCPGARRRPYADKIWHGYLGV